MSSFPEARSCTAEDLPDVIALVDAAMRQGSSQTLLTDYPLVYHPSNLENIAVLRVESELAASVPVLRRAYVLEGCALSLGIICATATSPQHQHRGYGSRCLDFAIGRMDVLGCELSILWTRVATFPFYESRGWGAVRPQGVTWTATAADAARVRRGPETVILLDPADRPMVDWIAAVHESDATSGIRRQPAEWPPLLSLPNMGTWLAMDAGQPRAYLVVSNATNKPGLLEGGGDEAALETLLAAALERLEPTEAVDLPGQTEGTTTRRVLDRTFPADPPSDPANPMVRINDLGAFLVRIAPALARRNHLGDRELSLEVSDGGELVSLAFRGGSLAVGHERMATHLRATRAEWAGHFFGGHPERPVELTEPLRDMLPLAIPISVLDRS